MFYKKGLIVDESDPLFFIVSFSYSNRGVFFNIIPDFSFIFFSCFFIFLAVKCLGDRTKFLSFLNMLFGSTVSSKYLLSVKYYDKTVAFLGGEKLFRVWLFLFCLILAVVFLANTLSKFLVTLVLWLLSSNFSRFIEVYNKLDQPLSFLVLEEPFDEFFKRVFKTIIILVFEFPGNLGSNSSNLSDDSAVLEILTASYDSSSSKPSFFYKILIALLIAGIWILTFIFDVIASIFWFFFGWFKRFFFGRPPVGGNNNGDNGDDNDGPGNNMNNRHLNNNFDNVSDDSLSQASSALDSDSDSGSGSEGGDGEILQINPREWAALQIPPQVVDAVEELEAGPPVGADVRQRADWAIRVGNDLLAEERRMRELAPPPLIDHRPFLIQAPQRQGGVLPDGWLERVADLGQNVLGRFPILPLLDDINLPLGIVIRRFMEVGQMNDQLRVPAHLRNDHGRIQELFDRRRRQAPNPDLAGDANLPERAGLGMEDPYAYPDVNLFDTQSGFANSISRLPTDPLLLEVKSDSTVSDSFDNHFLDNLSDSSEPSVSSNSSNLSDDWPFDNELAESSEHPNHPVKPSKRSH
jgi:hypothetical protein